MTADPLRVESIPTTLRSPLARRLVIAFVTIAVTAVLAFAGLTLWRAKHTVGRLADDRRQETAEAIARTIALGYRQSGSWTTTDIHPASMLAVQAGATITVTDPSGRELSLPNSMGPMSMATPERGRTAVTKRAPVIVDNTTIALVTVSFTNGELAAAEQHVRDALRGTVALGALVAALAAVAVAIPLSRRIVAPLTRITDTARRLGDGDATARVSRHEAPGELGILAATFDQMAERLQAHEQTRRNLIADLAHELRTPLTLLQGSCEELLDGNEQPDLARMVELHDDILRLRRLVDDLTTLADADTAITQHTPGHQPVDLAATAALAADRLHDLIAANHHQLITDFEPVAVHGDRTQLLQIITNLLTNAIKYTPSGGVIRLAVNADHATSMGVLTVADNGPGIDDRDRPHVFERFYRAQHLRHITGSGIGLAVAHQLVTAHHGTVTIDSHPIDGACVDGNRPGTTVRVCIPLHHASAP